MKWEMAAQCVCVCVYTCPGVRLPSIRSCLLSPGAYPTDGSLHSIYLLQLLEGDTEDRAQRAPCHHVSEGKWGHRAEAGPVGDHLSDR